LLRFVSRQNEEASAAIERTLSFLKNKEKESFLDTPPIVFAKIFNILITLR